MVHDCSLNCVVNIAHCIHLFIQPKCAMFKRRLYSNTVTIMLFFSDVRQYVPVKLCKTAGSIHLFQIYGQLDPKSNNSRNKLSMGT